MDSKEMLDRAMALHFISEIVERAGWCDHDFNDGDGTNILSRQTRPELFDTHAKNPYVTFLSQVWESLGAPTSFLEHFATITGVQLVDGGVDWQGNGDPRNYDGRALSPSEELLSSYAAEIAEMRYESPSKAAHRKALRWYVDTFFDQRITTVLSGDIGDDTPARHSVFEALLYVIDVLALDLYPDPTALATQLHTSFRGYLALPRHNDDDYGMIQDAIESLIGAYANSSLKDRYGVLKQVISILTLLCQWVLTGQSQKSVPRIDKGLKNLAYHVLRTAIRDFGHFDLDKDFLLTRCEMIVLNLDSSESAGQRRRRRFRDVTKSLKFGLSKEGLKFDVEETIDSVLNATHTKVKQRAWHGKLLSVESKLDAAIPKLKALAQHGPPDPGAITPLLEPLTRHDQPLRIRFKGSDTLAEFPLDPPVEEDSTAKPGKKRPSSAWEYYFGTGAVIVAQVIDIMNSNLDAELRRNQAKILIENLMVPVTQVFWAFHNREERDRKKVTNLKDRVSGKAKSADAWKSVAAVLLGWVELNAACPPNAVYAEELLDVDEIRDHSGARFLFDWWCNRLNGKESSLEEHDREIYHFEKVWAGVPAAWTQGLDNPVEALGE